MSQSPCAPTGQYGARRIRCAPSWAPPVRRPGKSCRRYGGGLGVRAICGIQRRFTGGDIRSSVQIGRSSEWKGLSWRRAAAALLVAATLGAPQTAEARRGLCRRRHHRRARRRRHHRRGLSILSGLCGLSGAGRSPRSRLCALLRLIHRPVALSASVRSRTVTGWSMRKIRVCYSSSTEMRYARRRSGAELPSDSDPVPTSRDASRRVIKIGTKWRGTLFGLGRFAASFAAWVANLRGDSGSGPRRRTS